MAEAVSFLYGACQTPAERRVIKSDVQYPTQQYKEASSEELLAEAVAEVKELEAGELVSEQDFVDLLFTKAICAWGACYPRRF